MSLTVQGSVALASPRPPSASFDYTRLMTNTVRQTEVWLRGAVPGIEPMLMPVVHALLQAKEDIEHLAATVPADDVWAKPGGAASIGFHVRHIGGSIDRLFTYARGESLDAAQKAALRDEGSPTEPPPAFDEIVADTRARIERALEQVRQTSRESLLDSRRVGRAGLPSTVLGLLMHGAEHATRHVGQAITTARILAGLRNQ
jgi:hypothetical protein